MASHSPFTTKVEGCARRRVTCRAWYDPDLNPSYAALAAHYTTAVVQARPVIHAIRQSPKG